MKRSGGTGSLGQGEQADWAVGSRRTGAREAGGLGLGEQVDWRKGSRRTGPVGAGTGPVGARLLGHGWKADGARGS
jgi:hypothetical protein